MGGNRFVNWIIIIRLKSRKKNNSFLNQGKKQYFKNIYWVKIEKFLSDAMNPIKHV